jgi:hypothetical protein
LALCSRKSLERLRRSESSFLKRSFRKRLLSLLDQVEEEGDPEQLLVIVRGLPEEGLSLASIAKGVKGWKSRIRIEKRRREKEVKKQLAPFASEIDRIVSEWRSRNPSSSTNMQIGLGMKSGRLHRYLCEYVLNLRALPQGRHEIPNYDPWISSSQFEVDFDTFQRSDVR